MKNSESRKLDLKKNKSLLPWIWLVAAFIVYAVFYAIRIDNILDSDMSSEMVLAKLLNSEHGILSKNWSYSTEIRFLNNQMLFQLFLLITGSMQISRILTGITLGILLLYGYYYMCKSMGIQKYYPYTAAFLILPFSVQYTDIVLMGLYYYPHIIISFFSVGLIVNANTSDGIKRRKLLVILAVLSLIAGIGGMRQLVVCYIPVILVSLLYFYKKKKLAYIGSYVAFISSVAGYLINSKVLHRIYDFNGWDGIKFKIFSFDSLGNVIKGIFNCMGFSEVEIFTFDVVRNIFFFTCLVGLFLYYSYLRKNKDEVSDDEWFSSVLLVMMILVYIAIYVFTDMFYQDRYALPLVVFAVPLLALSLAKHEWKSISILIVEIALGLIIALNSYSIYKEQYKIDKTAELKNIVNVLEEEGYSAGYGTYWNSNIMAELSNGKFEMYTWDNTDHAVNVDDLYDWLIDKRKLKEKPKGKIFVILKGEEMTTCPIVRYVDADDYVYLSETYMVLGYENYEDMLYKTSDFTYNLEDSSWLTDGYSEEGKWIMNPKCQSKGPTITYYKGTYLVTFTGENVEWITVNATSNFGENMLLTECIEQSSNKCVYAIYVDNTQLFGDVILTNSSDAQIKVDYVRVEKLND